MEMLYASTTGSNNNQLLSDTHYSTDISLKLVWENANVRKRCSKHFPELSEFLGNVRVSCVRILRENLHLHTSPEYYANVPTVVEVSDPDNLELQMSHVNGKLQKIS